jgi:hypothetical protein
MLVFGSAMSYMIQAARIHDGPTVRLHTHNLTDKVYITQSSD